MSKKYFAPKRVGLGLGLVIVSAEYNASITCISALRKLSFATKIKRQCARPKPKPLKPKRIFPPHTNFFSVKEK